MSASMAPRALTYLLIQVDVPEVRVQGEPSRVDVAVGVVPATLNKLLHDWL